MNDTTFQGDGKIAYVPVVVNTKRTKQTNADRIRSMSDEELADEYIRIYEQLGRYTDSWAWLRGWLKEEVSE